MAEQSATAAAEDWEVEYFYYGHMEGTMWRHRGDEYQVEFEVGVPGFDRQELLNIYGNPILDMAENQIEIQDILKKYSKGVEELHLLWHDRTETHAPAAWVKGWKAASKESYLRSRDGGWANADGSYPVPELFLEAKDYEHSRALSYSGPYSKPRAEYRASKLSSLRWELGQKHPLVWKLNMKIYSVRRHRKQLTGKLTTWNRNRRILIARGRTASYWAPEGKEQKQNG